MASLRNETLKECSNDNIVFVSCYTTTRQMLSQCEQYSVLGYVLGNERVLTSWGRDPRYVALFELLAQVGTHQLKYL